MYNGIRHFIFLLPPLAVLGGLAAARIADGLCAMAGPRGGAAVLLAVGIASPVIDMARLHPYEYTHYNHVAGGAAAARDELHARLLGTVDQAGIATSCATSAARQEKPLRRRNGRSRSADRIRRPRRLGSAIPATWDPKGADFAMMLGEFYCAKLDAPVLFDIVREGVVYARVYDIRGRSITTLLTVRGPDL